ncbi:MAG: hypothetical protein KJZ69_15770 [Phycisphaerales bacterium]|nr:hypothetical protein [Phycisphaerales bacterium]
MKGYGVRRLVVINSGSYHFADISLDGPIHLVAPNNRGKSTLVNALQFLYIDDFRCMRFPKSADETREHYFGNAISYLLFECATTTGPQSLLVVGRGRVNSSSFSRFVFSGGYQPADFQDDDRRVVPFDVLRTRLADRSLTDVRPAQLWEVLGTPTRRIHPEHNGHPTARLGLLPTKTREDYRSFRETYVRLLSLSDANAAELRRLLISCHAAQVGEIKLDVAADYRDEFERAERTDNRLAFVKAVMPLVDEGERMRAEIESHAELLRMSTPGALAEAARLQTVLLASDREFDRLIADVAAAQGALTEERSKLERQIGSTETQQGQISRELGELDTLHARWSACSPEMLLAMRDNAEVLQERVAALRENLRQAGTFNLDAMRRSTAALRNDADAQERSLANWERRVSAWLLAQGLKPEELAELFRLLNPALLHLLVGEDVEVSDATALQRRLRTVAGNISADTYADQDVSIKLASIRGPGSDDLRSPETARQNLDLIRHRLEDELRRLKVAEDVDRAKSELGTLEGEYARARARLAEYDLYVSRWQDRPSLQSRLEELKGSFDGATAALGKLADESGRLMDKAAILTSERTAIAALTNSLATSLQKAHSDLENAQVVADTPLLGSTAPSALPMKELRKLVDACSHALEEIATRAQAIRASRAKLKSVQNQIIRISQDHAAQQVYFSDEEAEWAELIDGRHALAELEQTASQNWETLFTTITAKLDGLVLGARAIGTAATRINSAMRRHRVSNLREVQLDVARQHEACDLLESLTKPDGLFADPEALGRAKDQLRRWIKDGKVIQLDDLFAVRIRVQGMDGSWTEAHSLDDIGSTGTRMTAKAMIFIQLVRAVVGDERYRLHFYLDETGQLDDYNLHAITRMASERGIVPITAEPRIRVEPLAHPAVTVYALGQNADGKFHVDARRTIRAARRANTPENAAHVAEPA